MEPTAGKIRVFCKDWIYQKNVLLMRWKIKKLSKNISCMISITTFEHHSETTVSNFKDIVNLAVNNTVSRTCITSVTTLFVVLVLFLFGGSGISGFAFALLIGIMVGTYSSIFIATPVVVDTTGDKNIFDAPIVVEAEESNSEEEITKA